MDYLTTRAAAELLGLSPATLAKWRVFGCGPRFRRFGRRVTYARADLAQWADRQSRQSTSEAHDAA